MKLFQPSAEIYVWDQSSIVAALERTTHLAICAHPDDVEIMAAHGILECFHRHDRGFTGVVVTDGAGSARTAGYAGATDLQMRATRRIEQKKAAFLGEYSAQLLLDHPSSFVRGPGQRLVVDELSSILSATRPQVVYTHNPFDRHDTHVAVALLTIEALRRMREADRPKHVIGGEVWGDLDWLPEADKVVMDVSQGEHLQASLLGVFDSQIAGGKRYDLAALGRRKANATFRESHAVDRATGVIYGVDLMPLIRKPELAVADWAQQRIEVFRAQVTSRIDGLGRVEQVDDPPTSKTMGPV